MNPELERELETEISRALRDLPNLAAPPGFLARTMTALQRPVAWYARSWAEWNLATRIAFLVFALMAVAALFLGWRAVEPGLLATATRHLAPVTGGVTSVWKILSALAGGLALAAEHLGKGFMLACLAVMVGAWALCAGLGTMLVRLVSARPGRMEGI
jgi:hypothetical protein